MRGASCRSPMPKGWAAVFVLRTAVSNLWKHRRRDFFAVLVTVLIFLFLAVYAGSLEKNEEQIFRLAGPVRKASGTRPARTGTFSGAGKRCASSATGCWGRRS